MSNIPNRILNIGKAYLDQVRARIDAELTEREKDLAERELDARPGDPEPAPGREAGGVSRDDNSPEALMRRAEERIAAARRAAESRAELDRLMDEATNRSAGANSPARPQSGPASEAAPRPAGAPPAPAGSEADPNASDYRVLGVPVGSDLATVQAAYETLSRRCDPTRFEGSEYRKDAEKILARINTAYDSLRRRLDPTENRFGKLEFE